MGGGRRLPLLQQGQTFEVGFYFLPQTRRVLESHGDNTLLAELPRGQLGAPDVRGYDMRMGRCVASTPHLIVTCTVCLSAYRASWRPSNSVRWTPPCHSHVIATIGGAWPTAVRRVTSGHLQGELYAILYLRHVSSAVPAHGNYHCTTNTMVLYDSWFLP